jgi:hypothetical protein
MASAYLAEAKLGNAPVFVAATDSVKIGLLARLARRFLGGL